MTPEAVQIVREMIKHADYRTQMMRAAATERHSAGDSGSQSYYLKLARESEAEAEALSSLLAVVEQIGKLPSFTHFDGATEYCELCEHGAIGGATLQHAAGCLELARQALSSVVSETREG